MNIKPFDDKKELLYRGFIERFIQKDGTVASAAFKDERGLSLIRGFNDSINDMNIYSRKKLPKSKKVGHFSVWDSENINAVLLHTPSKNDDRHSEIHGNEKEIALSSIQSFILSKKAILD